MMIKFSNVHYNANLKNINTYHFFDTIRWRFWKIKYLSNDWHISLSKIIYFVCHIRKITNKKIRFLVSFYITEWIAITSLFLSLYMKFPSSKSKIIRSLKNPQIELNLNQHRIQSTFSLFLRNLINSMKFNYFVSKCISTLISSYSSL